MYWMVMETPQYEMTCRIIVFYPKLTLHHIAQKECKVQNSIQKTLKIRRQMPKNAESQRQTKNLTSWNVFCFLCLSLAFAFF